jgi:hypothetical protein
MARHSIAAHHHLLTLVHNPNAMGYIIACGILNSARETFITDSISHKFVFVLVLTAVCVCLALAIELLPKVMLMLTDRRRMSHNQTVRFQMIGEKLIGIWLPWILAVAWNQLLRKTLNVARWVLVFHATWTLTCSHAHMLTNSHTHTLIRVRPGHDGFFVVLFTNVFLLSLELGCFVGLFSLNAFLSQWKDLGTMHSDQSMHSDSSTNVDNNSMSSEATSTQLALAGLVQVSNCFASNCNACTNHN